MTTDSATAAWQAAASERDILATKLYVPALCPGWLPQPRLAEQLDKALISQ